MVHSLSLLPLFLGGHAKSSNKDAAQNMASALKGGGGGNNSPLKDALALEGNGRVAGFASCKVSKTGGWGNVGSTILENQVSRRNKEQSCLGRPIRAAQLPLR